LHAWLALIAGLLAVVAGSLIISASLGLALALPVELILALAVTLLIIAGIAAWLFYAGVQAQYKRVKTGKEALIGAHGIVTTDLKPKGEVRVLGEFWQAKAKDGQIPNGTEVQVLCLDGMFLVVKVAEEKLNSTECQ
jgi:membrane-bound serine protease (ClpP class)